ncbi:nucleoside diphosphate kinase 6 isoform X2 [Pleurodeles waltl]|uniref:nucleoside diphosphate kinase 6 isoform X2 n=1 Tax=Pleurodeles waltl TaxID=8319 RepID=UPI003709C454
MEVASAVRRSSVGSLSARAEYCACSRICTSERPHSTSGVGPRPRTFPPAPQGLSKIPTMIHKHGNKVLQLTLAVIKPDAVAHPLISEAVHEKILSNRLLIIRSKILNWTRSDSQNFYTEHSGRFFYQRLVEFMSRTHRKNAVREVGDQSGELST